MTAMGDARDARAETRLPARGLDRARRWYAEKLGLEPSEERGVSCVFASTGSSDGTFTQMGFTVEDIEATIAELRSRGVVFEE
jgi:hypothetical protein